MKANQLVTGLPSRPSPEVAHIVSTAKRLRAVRKACRQFLLLWSFERGNKLPGDPRPSDTGLIGPDTHDWSHLYLGSVLDD